MKKMSFVIQRCVRPILSKKQSGYFKHLVVAVLFVSSLLTSVDGWGQTLYQSRDSGPWEGENTWEISVDGDPFKVTSVPPNRGNNDGTTIRSGNNVTVGDVVEIDQLTVLGELTVGKGASFRVFNSGSNPDLLVLAGGKINNSSGVVGRGTSLPEVIIEGTFVNEGEGVLNGENLAVTFQGSTGLYEHNRNGGILPIAKWLGESTCAVKGILDANPGNRGQDFRNFSWNCPDMNDNHRLGDDITAMSVSGLFELISTGASSELWLFQPTLSVKNFRQTGGSLRIASGLANRTLNVTDDFSLSAGAIVISSGAESAGILNVGGNFSHTGGTISEASSIDKATINFNGGTDVTAPQFYTGGGVFSGTIDFNISSGSTLNFGTSGATVDFSGSSGLFTNNGTITGQARIAVPTRAVVNTTPDPDFSGPALVNNGTIAPGNSPGTIFILGALISTGTLSMEVSSTAHDIINVTGAAILTGSLEVDFIDGFVPTVPPDVSYDLIQVTGLFLLDFAEVAVSVEPSASILTWEYGLADAGAAGRLLITSVLPIDLVSFTGKRRDNAIELNWRTATEENNDYMAVERSLDGSRFTEIGRVKGVGTTQEIQDYSLIDESPSPGANYYRLRQVDYDGVFEYHPVIFVDFIEQSSSKLMTVFPNPATERMRVSWQAGDNTITELRVFSMTGQLLETYEVNGENGTYELPVQNLAAGTYQLQLSQGSKMEAIRFIKH